MRSSATTNTGPADMTAHPRWKHPRAADPHAMLAAVAAYHAEHGRLPPKTFVSNGLSVGTWLRNQRRAARYPGEDGRYPDPVVSAGLEAIDASWAAFKQTASSAAPRPRAKARVIGAGEWLEEFAAVRGLDISELDLGPSRPCTDGQRDDIGRRWVCLRVDLIGAGRLRSAPTLGVKRCVTLLREWSFVDLAVVLCHEFARHEREHLFRFTTEDGQLFESSPNREEWDEAALGVSIPLSTVDLVPGYQIDHLFDYGDQWRHRITVERLTHRTADTIAACERADRSGSGYVLYREDGEAIPQYPAFAEDGEY